MISANHDTGKWAQQYSYSTQDGLFGARVLYNFPATAATRLRSNSNGLANYLSHQAGSDNQSSKTIDRKKLVDEEEMMDNVLKGRFSAGGELYFSTQKKSAGVSTGIRFCTIPDPPGTVLTQQPTVISATLNPIMGQISMSYGTKIGPNLALASRFDFNLFSFDSDITFGLEWLQKKKKRGNSKVNGFDLPSVPVTSDEVGKPLEFEQGRLKSYVKEAINVTNGASTMNNNLIHYFWRTASGLEDALSILRARVSPVTGLTVMWEGRWKECLIGIGLQSEFLVSPPLTSTSLKSGHNPVIGAQNLRNVSHRDQFQRPLIKGICFELQYTTDN